MKAQLVSRITLLSRAANDPLLQALLLERARRDIVWWINTFCWTFDPRQFQPHRPFVLYPYQEDFVRRLCRQLEAGEDLLVEKSRDMGVSWLVLLTFQHYWLFRDGANFHLGSRKQEYVDRKGDISTLFEKLRYNLSWLPGWMRPDGFAGHRHDTLMKLINPVNGNVITGESSNANFARGGRYRAVLFDEFPFWPDEDAAFASAGQSSPCRVLVGTPYGKNNRFAGLRFGGSIAVETLHWRLHPNKDDAWYAHEKRRMSEDEVARELDINYHLSVRNRVFNNFGERNKADLTPIEGRRIIRSWDFGYHCPACLFIQIDADDRLLVLREVVGSQELITDFARRVLAISDDFADGSGSSRFEDYCDPAGAQRTDKAVHTSIEVLNGLGIYPFYQRTMILDGLELIRLKLPPQSDGSPGLLVDGSCLTLIEAFEGGYRYPPNGAELPMQEHPYEDVMDCLRYAAVHKLPIPGKPPRKRPIHHHRPQNRYTGY